MLSLILCGGSGTRLWPLSRRHMPKQFYPLINQESLFQGIIERNAVFTRKFAVAVNNEQSFIAFEQLQRNGILERNGLIEPVGRNTAPAIALVSFLLDPDEVMLVNPSDHIIADASAYQAAVTRAIELAKAGSLVTFGIEPTYPETGYGYIEHDGEKALSFKEKPDGQTAARYVESGRYLWNAGIFCFTAGAFLSELARLSPDVYDACRKVALASGKKNDDSVLRPTCAEMETIPSISVDYAVFERSNRVAVVPCDIGWSDLGSFDALYPVLYDKRSGNSVISETEPLFINSKDNLVVANSNKKLVFIDVENVSVIDTEDALLVMKRGSSQKVKDAVSILQNEASSLLLSHTTVVRPWGSYTVLLDTDRVKVKRIIVNPGHRLSLQRHSKRQEHWVCVDGTGMVFLDGKNIALERTVEVHIPVKSIHRAECVGSVPLVIIETQIGEYFGEDDIERFEDDYDRLKA